MSNQDEIKCSELVAAFQLNRGDIVMVSSDLTRLMWASKDSSDPITPDAVLDGIQKVIGPEGTLILPTYNWGFCEGKGFNYKTTKGKTGVLGAVALKRPDFKRTLHPIYSFAVWGKDQALLCQLQNKSSFGSDSPFAYLHRNNAINIMIDVDYLHSLTYVHYVEEQTGLAVPYRYLKEFTGEYVDEHGNKDIRTYSMFVRNLDMNVEMTLNPLGSILEQEGLSESNNFYGVSVKSIRFGDIYKTIQSEIVNNQSETICNYDL